MTALKIEDIRPSPTNPRKQFDAHKLKELAASIQAHGLIQPVLVRPMVLSSGEHFYELVAGERRWRASRQAGLESIPAIVRLLGDVDVLEIQVIENLQRDDLHPLEEAAGYDQLIKAHGYRPEDLAVKVGKSKRYIYQRIQLLTLTPKVRKAFTDGIITPSVADRLARIPNPEIQEEALEKVGPNKWSEECVSVREAERIIADEFMLRLKDAPFNVKAAYSVPVGGAYKQGCAMTTVSTCADCPKRTGNQKELFPEVQSADLCTDPVCYGQKVDARWRELKGKAEARQQVVIEGAEAQKVHSDYRNADLDSTCYDDPDRRKWRQVLKEAIKAGELLPMLVRTGNEIVEVVAKKEALKVAGLGREDGAENSSKAEAKKREALKKLRIEVATTAIPGVIEALNPVSNPGAAVWQLLADALAGQASAEVVAFVAKRRGLCAKNTEANEAVENWLTAKRTLTDLGGFVLELIVLAQHGVSTWTQEFDEHFVAACELAEVDLKVLEKRIKGGEVRERGSGGVGKRGKGGAPSRDVVELDGITLAVPVALLHEMSELNQCSVLQTRNPKVKTIDLDERDWVVTAAQRMGNGVLAVEASEALPAADWCVPARPLAGYEGTRVLVKGKQCVLGEGRSFYGIDPETLLVDLHLEGRRQAVTIERARIALKAGEVTDACMASEGTSEPSPPKKKKGKARPEPRPPAVHGDPVFDSFVEQALSLIKSEPRTTTVLTIRDMLNLDTDTAMRVFDAAIDQRPSRVSGGEA